MLILWIRRKKPDKDNKPGKDNKQEFQKHKIEMKKFQMSHPDTEITSLNDIVASSGNSLVPVSNVKLSEHIQN